MSLALAEVSAEPRTRTEPLPAPLRLPVAVKPRWQTMPAADWTREEVLDAARALSKDGQALDAVCAERLADELLDIEEELSLALSDDLRREIEACRRGLSAANRQLGSTRTALISAEDQLRAERRDVAELRAELSAAQSEVRALRRDLSALNVTLALERLVVTVTGASAADLTARLNAQVRGYADAGDAPDTVVIDVEVTP